MGRVGIIKDYVKIIWLHSVKLYIIIKGSRYFGEYNRIDGE